MAKDGLTRAKTNSIKGAQKYYEISRSGSAKVINTLGKAGGDLWIKTKDGLSRASRNSIKQRYKTLHSIGKSGLVDVKNTTIEKSGQLYRSSNKGLIRIQDATKSRWFSSLQNHKQWRFTNWKINNNEK